MNADFQEAAKHLTADLAAQIELYVLEQGPLRIEQTPDGARFVAKQDMRLRLKEAVEIREQAIRDCITAVEALESEAPTKAHADGVWNAASALRALLEDT